MREAEESGDNVNRIVKSNVSRNQPLSEAIE